MTMPHVLVQFSAMRHLEPICGKRVDKRPWDIVQRLGLGFLVPAMGVRFPLSQPLLPGVLLIKAPKMVRRDEKRDEGHTA